jgi:hypothetical protein
VERPLRRVLAPYISKLVRKRTRMSSIYSANYVRYAFRGDALASLIIYSSSDTRLPPPNDKEKLTLTLDSKTKRTKSCC